MTSPITTEARVKKEVYASSIALDIYRNVPITADEELSGSQSNDGTADSHDLSSLSRSAQPEAVWNKDEQAAFELGLSLFSLDFIKTARLVGTKSVSGQPWLHHNRDVACESPAIFGCLPFVLHSTDRDAIYTRVRAGNSVLGAVCFL